MSLQRWGVLIGAVLFVITSCCSCIDRCVIKPAVEKRMFSEVNRYRVAQGLSALEIDGRIVAVARAYSRDMAKGKIKIGHAGSSRRFEAIAKKGLVWVSAAENVAFRPKRQDLVRATIAEWAASRCGHRQNMEGDFKVTGIGVVKDRITGYYYITQIFIKPR